ncbi:hypothetical protein SLA2020_273300 [Shorea laevis]
MKTNMAQPAVSQWTSCREEGSGDGAGGAAEPVAEDCRLCAGEVPERGEGGTLRKPNSYVLSLTKYECEGTIFIV